MNLDLSGKTALVCGASQGIGLACARQLTTLGCRIILLARREKILKALVEKLEIHYPAQHSYIAVDVSDKKALKEKVRKEMKKHNGIDILVNNMKAPSEKAIEAATEQDFTQDFDQHLQVNALLATLLLPDMKAKGYGRIINIISISVKTPLVDLGVSNVARWSVAAWAKTLSLEVAEYGVTVNCILPGYTDTEALDELIGYRAKKQKTTPETLRNELKSSIPIKRFAKPEEIGSAAAFLASPAASYINGIALTVDGGLTKCL